MPSLSLLEVAHRRRRDGLYFYVKIFLLPTGYFNVPSQDRSSSSISSWKRNQLPIDRKSTRLNSSHANISYAVFCLKKKKNTFLSLNRRKNHRTKICHTSSHRHR